MKNNVKNSIIDLQNSRETSGVYHSRDFYKGTSFKMSGEWMRNTHYFNNSYVVDFVSYGGALLSCVKDHISSDLNKPILIKNEDIIIGIAPNEYWNFVLSGTEGPEGKVWVPVVENGIISWKISDSVPESADIRGPKGDTPKIEVQQEGDEYFWIIDGEIVKDPETGDPVPATGPEQEFKIELDNDIHMAVLYCRAKGKEEWIELGPVGGAPKLVKVLGDSNDPNAPQDETTRNDRILWGYDGIPQSQWATLCYMDDLRGDNNIFYGCEEPSTDKIWFDPCDSDTSEFSAKDFLYQSYLEIGGTLSQEAFEQALTGLTNVSGFKIEFRSSFADLGQPTANKLNTLFFIPATVAGSSDLYEEYIVLYKDGVYRWERWGSGSVSADLSDYYTKEQIDIIKENLETTMSIVWHDIN